MNNPLSTVTQPEVGGETILRRVGHANFAIQILRGP